MQVHPEEYNNALIASRLQFFLPVMFAGLLGGSALMVAFLWANRRIRRRGLRGLFTEEDNEGPSDTTQRDVRLHDRMREYKTGLRVEEAIAESDWDGYLVGWVGLLLERIWRGF
jgi:hypothetical protein